MSGRPLMAVPVLSSSDTCNTTLIVRIIPQTTISRASPWTHPYVDHGLRDIDKQRQHTLVYISKAKNDIT